LPNVIDIRNFGLIGAIELAPRAPVRPARAATRCSRAPSTITNGDVIACRRH
jgi:adenosylmethionine-8-amino-7-oxononanoate aminotransferase